MTNNLDTLLTALYVHLDDRVLPALGWQRFFFLTTLTGLPAVLLLLWQRRTVRALDRDDSA